MKVVGECLDRKDWIFKDQAVRSRRELDSEHVEKYGYISLFPFMAGLMVPGDYD